MQSTSIIILCSICTTFHIKSSTPDKRACCKYFLMSILEKNYWSGSDRQRCWESSCVLMHLFVQCLPKQVCTQCETSIFSYLNVIGLYQKTCNPPFRQFTIRIVLMMIHCESSPCFTTMHNI